jgi:DNA-binding NarL/FixJ family response regulator
VVAEASLERGRIAYAANRWLEAYDSLLRANEALGADDLELLARAAYMLGNDDGYVGGLERAHRAHRDAGDVPRAVRCAFWLGHHWMFRGDPTRAGGWLERAQRELAESGVECVERGYLLAPLGLQQMSGGEFQNACETFAEIAEIAAGFGDEDLLWLARVDQSRALMGLGRVKEAMRLLDEALVVVTSGELSPIVTGMIYCNTISVCHDAFVVRHAARFNEALTEWCASQPDMVAYNGLCLVHRAEILQLRGAWAEALDAATDAVEKFGAGVMNQLASGSAHYRRGEIYRLRGDNKAAEAAYREASLRGVDPQPGLSLLRLAQGKTEAAAASIRRAMTEQTEPLARVPLLAAYVEIMVAAGEHDRAGAAAEELAEIAESNSTELVAAVAVHAAGAVALARSNAESALVSLRAASKQWRDLEARYEEASARMLIGEACRALGDEDSAQLEYDAAEATFAELGAPHASGAHDTFGLSSRELEVLGLITTGMTNRAIASTLSISEHTVARHVRNILTKLDVSSRTAASAFAHDHALL